MPSPGFETRGRDWYKNAIAKGDALVSAAYKAATGDTVVTIAAPYSFPNGKLAGVLGMDINLSVLTRVIENSTIGLTGYIILVQDDGTILANPKNKNSNFSKISSLKVPAFANLDEMKNSAKEVSIGDKTYLATVYTSPQLGYHFIGLITKDEAMGKAFFIQKLVAILAVILVVFFSLLGLWLANSIVNPLNRVAALVQEIEREGDLTKRLVIEKDDEVGSLAGLFNSFIEKLYSIIKELTPIPASGNNEA